MMTLSADPVIPSVPKVDRGVQAPPRSLATVALQAVAGAMGVSSKRHGLCCFKRTLPLAIGM